MTEPVQFPRDRRVLITGGARSGKSRLAEQLLAAHQVDYVATGYPPDAADPEWQARVAAHRARRPASWTTLETLDLARLLSERGDRPLLVDCLSLWLTRTLDRTGWDTPDAVQPQVDALVTALERTRRQVVLVTNEVGWGVVPDTASGRIFRDLLGVLNARCAAACERVVLCVSGIPVVVK